MKKFYKLRKIFLLVVACLSLSLYSQNIIWQADFGSEDAFRQWTVVDANNDGVTWGYEPGVSLC